MSLAGFAGLVSALRRSHEEWREAERQAAIGIVMMCLLIVVFALMRVPIVGAVDDETLGLRISSALVGIVVLVRPLFFARGLRGVPEWRRPSVLLPFMAIQAGVGLGSLANAALALPWLYELALLLYFLVPAGIFMVFLVSIGTSRRG
jgi:hypothetical protein